MLETTLVDIRGKSKATVASSEIKLDDSRLHVLCESLQANGVPGDHPFVTDSDMSLTEKIALVLLFGTVNYCYTDPRTDQEYRFENNGVVYARSTGFNQALLHSGLNWLDLDGLSALSYDKWCGIFQLSAVNNLYDAKNRHTKFCTMADYLKNVQLDRFFTLYNDTDKIFTLLKNSGLFEDPFYKRAQITLSLLGRLNQLYGDGSLGVSAPLTVMADYRLPQVLYNFGVLELPIQLLNRLVRHDSFVKNEQFERELRAWTIVLGERLARELDVSEEEIDARLWALSQDMIHDGRMNVPAMLVMTDCY